MAERELDGARLSEENASQLSAADRWSINGASADEDNRQSDENKESGEAGEISREAAPHWQMFYRAISDAVKRMRE